MRLPLVFVMDMPDDEQHLPEASNFQHIGPKHKRHVWSNGGLNETFGL